MTALEDILFSRNFKQMFITGIKTSFLCKYNHASLLACGMNIFSRQYINFQV